MTDQTIIPFNRHAEQALLGSVLINPDAYHDVAAFLEAGDFYIERHRWLWQAFDKLHEAHTLTSSLYR
jgi:replicative DNA helicase